MTLGPSVSRNYLYPDGGCVETDLPADLRGYWLRRSRFAANSTPVGRAMRGLVTPFPRQ